MAFNRLMEFFCIERQAAKNISKNAFKWNDNYPNNLERI